MKMFVDFAWFLAILSGVFASAYIFSDFYYNRFIREKGKWLRRNED